MIGAGTRQLQIRQQADNVMSVVDKITQEALCDVTAITVHSDLDPFTGDITTKAIITIVITDEDDIWPVEVVEGSVSSLLPAIVRM